jgi:uncharacterized protein (TIRG00374 family)
LKSARSSIPLIIGAAFFLGVLYSLGFSDTWQAVRTSNILFIALTAVFFVLPSYLRIYKWMLMRDRMGADISFSEISAVYFSSKFWGMVSPMRSGEVVPALAADGVGAKRGRLLSVILYDRVLETFQTAIVFVALFFLFYGMFFNVRAGFALAAIFVALGVFTFVLVTRRAGEKVFSFADGTLALLGGRKLASRIRVFLNTMKGEMDAFYSATESYFTIGFSLYNLLLTFICWALDLMFWVMLFKAMHMEAGLIIIVASVMVYSMMATLTPIPAGLGVADMSFALVLSRFGYAGEVGGIIVVGRLLAVVYNYLGYALSGMSRRRR